MVGDGDARAEGEKNADYTDSGRFLGRDRVGFLQVAASDGDCRERDEGGFRLDHRIHKDASGGGDADDRKNVYGADQLTGFGFGRDQDRGGGRERKGGGAGGGGGGPGVGAEGVDYKDMGVMRGEVSEVSQSDGTEDEDDGDMDDRKRQARGMDIVNAERAIPQFEDRIRQNSVVQSSRGMDGGYHQRPGPDRDRGLKPRPESSSSTYGIFSQPPAQQQVVGLSFLKYPAASPSGGQMGAHADGNAAAGQNGVGSGIPGVYGGGSGGGITREAYAKSVAREQSSGASHHQDQLQQGHHSHEGLQHQEEKYYTSLLDSSGPHNGIPQKDSDLAADAPSPSLKRNAAMMDLPSLRSVLRSILSDPVSGQLMEDATIFACGHTFGNLGLRQVLASSICISCGASVHNTSMAPAPNHALRAAVQALKREEEKFGVGSLRQEENFVGSRREEDNFATSKNSKRRRDRSEQDASRAMDHHATDGGRAKGVQFPYSVSERVLIKGNKRTPERFVGREAVITNQCLNGWYLVKTLDNGESVRLQYRSLEKLPGSEPSQSLIALS